MIRGCFHPRFRELNQFADRELEGPERARVANHLAECARCRGIVHSIRSLSRAAVQLRVSEPPPEMLDRIIARRREGDRVLLPLVAPPRAPSRLTSLRRVGRHAASIALLLVAAGLLTVATNVHAGRSQLEFEPSAPPPGSEITATYHGALFDGDEELRLRAEYHYRDGRVERVTAGRFARDGDERNTSFALPEDVVYALFAVENLEAKRVDSNQHRLWEILVHEDDRRPAFAALAAKMDDLVRRDWGAAYETALELVELYPNLVEAWRRLVSLDRGFAAIDETRTVPERHHEQFKLFEKRFQHEPDVTADEIAVLYRYAQAVADFIAADYWRKRLAAEAPGHRVTVQIRLTALAQGLYDQPLALLDSLEEMWQSDSPRTREDIAALAYFTAVNSENAEALGAWTPRYLQVRPEESLSAATQMLPHAELRNQAKSMIRLELERLKKTDGAGRRLTESLAAYASWRSQQIGTALVGLGEALIADGEIRAGLDSLRLAMDDGWDPVLFRRVTDGYLAAGDTTSALPIFARIAADPETQSAYVDSVGIRVGRHFPEAEWASLVDQAREEMRHHVLAQADLRYLPDDVPTIGPDGGEHDLNLLLQDTLSVVAFWSRSSPEAVADVSRLHRLARHLEEEGAALIAITNEPPSPAFTASMKQLEVDFPIYHDKDNAAQRAFSRWRWPLYYVVDTKGRIRFVNQTTEPIRRQITALRMTEEIAPTLTN